MAQEKHHKISNEKLKHKMVKSNQIINRLEVLLLAMKVAFYHLVDDMQQPTAYKFLKINSLPNYKFSSLHLSVRLSSCATL